MSPGSTPEVPMLEVQGVSKRFGSFVALNKVSARFPAGKLAAIIGPNGAGKSTLTLFSATKLPKRLLTPSTSIMGAPG